ncbi:hypothetical protein EUGRSUZ_H00533 [Eucalyptus grandis]|uniref:Uncharacterized protein n=2 Tax=Eucalyptus grandis TaxID=71139 RepID=A0ACC3JM22_EUCGR|nr:hypothetical protein EUGRSUZ_H00533 [Eucalyptus grandis]
MQMSGCPPRQNQHPCASMHDPSLSPPTSFIFFQQLQRSATTVPVGCFPVHMYVTKACSALEKGKTKDKALTFETSQSYMMTKYKASQKV